MCHKTVILEINDSLMKIQMTHEWQIYEIWHNYDRFMTFIWQIYDRYVRMIDLWQLYDSFLTDLWHFYVNDRFMIVLWQIYDSFVKIVGPTLDKSTEKVQLKLIARI